MLNLHSENNVMTTALVALFALSKNSTFFNKYFDRIVQKPKILHAECLPPDTCMGQFFQQETTPELKRSTLL